MVPPQYQCYHSDAVYLSDPSVHHPRVARKIGVAIVAVAATVVVVVFDYCYYY